jgi:hypothetical protein
LIGTRIKTGNMSTSKSKPDALETALASIPVTFRKKITKSYLDLKRRHAEAEYDAAGLSTGKFCEAVLRLLQNELTGSHTPFGDRIVNFGEACEKLTQTPKTAGNESLRIVIPRTLSFLYTLRNKRGIGHVGGDVDANEIDSATMARASDWITCELIRIYHRLSLEDAQALVDSISTRNIPIVWEVAGKKRVLQNSLNYTILTRPYCSYIAIRKMESSRRTSLSGLSIRTFRHLSARYLGTFIKSVSWSSIESRRSSTYPPPGLGM